MHCNLRRMDNGKHLMIVLLAYKLIMDVLYIKYISQLYRYLYLTVDLNIGDAVIAWFVYVVILVLFRPVLQKPFMHWRFSEFVFLMLLLLSVVPGLSMVGAGAFPSDYTCWFLLYWVSFFFFARLLGGMNIRPLQIQGQLSRRARLVVLYVIGVTTVMAVSFTFFYHSGGTFFFSGLLTQDLYDNREAWGHVDMPGILRYVLANATVILLFLVMWFCGKKRYLWAGVLVFVLYMHFSCGANKIVLLSSVVGVFVYAFRNSFTVKRWILLLSGTTAFGMMLWNLFGNLIILALLYRISFETNYLSFCYWDYFETHPSVIHGFWDGLAVNREGIPSLIGGLYRRSFTNYANNGLIGAAFMMAGHCGALLSPILWNIYLYCLDEMERRLPWWTKLSLGTYWAFIMMNASMFTTILSTGGLALLVLGYLSGDPEKPTKQKWVDSLRMPVT